MFAHSFWKTVTRTASITFLLCLMQAAASANNLTWYYNATLEDGGTVSGQFNYDASLSSNQLSAFTLSSTDAAFGDYTYNVGDSSVSVINSNLEFVFSQNGGNRSLTVRLNSELTDSGGTADTGISNEFLITGSPNNHNSTAVTLSTTAPTPEPSTIFLTLSAGAGLFLARRRLS